MKFPIIAAVLLILTAPVFTAEQAAAISQTLQWDIFNFETSRGICLYRKRDDPDNPGEEIEKECADADKLEKKLTAQGYCIYGEAHVGSPSKDGQHCYKKINNNIRHDRVCDIAQERVDPTTYNPEGGNTVMFGECKLIEDLPVGDLISRHHFWSALGCGFQAYREGKKLKDSPYKHHELTNAWKDGWKFARKSCTTGKLPTFNSNDIR